MKKIKEEKKVSDDYMPIIKYRNLLRDNRDKFRYLFKVDLTQFFSPLFGFDIVRFDEWLQTPDNISMHDYVQEKFGIEGTNIIKKLLE